MAKKVILITGSSRGIGRLTAIALARGGNKVYASMRSPSSGTEFSEVSKDIRKNISLKKLDVTDKDSIEKTVSDLLSEEGRLDVVINNAGYGLWGPLELVTDKEVQEQFDVNVFGLIRVIQAVIPTMREQRSGHVINISSIAGIISNPYLGVYSATKHAIEALSASLAATVFPWNIKVTVVEPAATATEFGEVLTHASALSKETPYGELMEDHRQQLLHALKEGQPAEEVATLIENIVSMENPDFRYQTSEKAKTLAEQFVTDPSGNRWLAMQKEKFAEWKQKKS